MGMREFTRQGVSKEPLDVFEQLSLCQGWRYQRNTSGELTLCVKKSKRIPVTFFASWHEPVSYLEIIGLMGIDVSLEKNYKLLKS